MPSQEQPALPQRHILCMKWGTKYGPEYVNRLYAMVRRHLSGDFNFVCLTDDTKGIRSEVQCFPIPPLALELAPGQVDRAWKKLTTFEENLYGLRGRALFIDLDVVIVGSLDAFFEYFDTCGYNHIEYEARDTTRHALQDDGHCSRDWPASQRGAQWAPGPLR